jgi:hypothetical protein
MLLLGLGYVPQTSHFFKIRVDYSVTSIIHDLDRRLYNAQEGELSCPASLHDVRITSPVRIPTLIPEYNRASRLPTPHIDHARRTRSNHPCHTIYHDLESFGAEKTHLSRGDNHNI